MLSVKIVNQSANSLPYYATTGAAGMDICANESISLAPMERRLVSTGLFIELPEGYEAQLRARSGMALKKGIILPNAPATIDSDYRGEIKVILANISSETQHIAQGERIAQMVVARHEVVQWQAVENLTTTQRNKGGFGSTGN